ncbi:MAG: deoxyribodipyrimidine photo-lyase/cryptochrome family protein [Flavobacteriales bacterium]
MDQLKQIINVVWMKRDLRTQDHEPLMLAEKAGKPYIIIFCFEPSIIRHPDTSDRHLQFQYQSLQQINEKLLTYGRSVHVFYSEILEVFSWLSNQFKIDSLYSYRESGIRLTWHRDRMVRQWCTEHTIFWNESKRDGIQRGIRNREGWDKQWHGFMHAPVIQNSFSEQVLSIPDHPFAMPQSLLERWSHYPREFQPAGEDMAFRYLHSFMETRGVNYNKHISKPAESRLSCGRISPYLAWGNVSVRQVVRFALEHDRATAGKRWVDGFLTRVKWRDHFIQKFEVECDYETRCINAGYESLVKPHHPRHVQAWEQGLTGFPLVDACMRCLQTTGWINFRMRAMLVSFFCHHLYQDWRMGTYHLARLFLDYEPGIHYPQFQMQAGTTGVNTVRMYNPVKQGHDHDPEGEFIKSWVPELAAVNIEYIHEPHRMPIEEQERCGVYVGIHYPSPIIELESAARHAREAIWGHRKKDEVKAEGKRIVETHARKRALSKKRKKGGEQLSLL